MSQSVAYLNIPEELAGRTIWTLWRYENHDGKQTKVPYVATKPTARAKVNDPSTWSTFDEACMALDDDRDGPKRFDGLMFAMTADDELVGVDFDHCFRTRAKAQVLHPVVIDFIEATSSYAEITPSGEGVRVLITAPGGIPAWSKHKAGLSGESPTTTVEVYEDKRFFTITGNIMRKTPDPIQEAEVELHYLCEQHLRKSEPKTAPAHTAISVKVTDDDNELLDRIERSANGGEFARLYRHGVTEHEDHSRADFYLCSALAFWTQRDATRMDRLFRASALMRPKWDRPARSGETYGEGTIARAIDATHEIYEPARTQDAISREAVARLVAYDRKAPGGENMDPVYGEAGAVTVTHDLPPWPVMAPVAFRGVLGEYIQAVSPFTEADDAGVLLHLLVMVGRMIGPDVVVEFGAEKHPAKVWGLVVGDTSRGRKGTAEGVARLLFKQVNHRRPMPFTHANVASGEALIWSVRDDHTEVGKDGKKRVIPGVADKRQLFIESEFASPLRVARRESSILSGVMRQAWGQDALDHTAKKDPATCEGGAHIAIVGHITPDELRKESRALDSSNGFLNRFLLFMVRKARHIPLAAKITDAVVDPFAERIVASVDQARGRPGAWETDAHARYLYSAWYDWNSQREDLPQRVSDLMARAEAYIPRLALIYAVLDSSHEIRATHIESALAVVEYAEDSARYLFGDGTPARSADERLLAMLIENHPAPVFRSDVLRENRTIKAAELDDAVVSLSRRRRIVETKHPPPAGGRPSTGYSLVEGTLSTIRRPRALADVSDEGVAR